MILLFKLLSAIVLLSSITVVNGYFYVPNFMSNLPFQDGSATAVRNNNALVLFGGENATNSYTNNLYQLTQTSDSFNWQILQQNNAPPGALYGQAIVVNNNNNMLLLGGMTNITNNQMVPLQNYQFDFNTNTWTPSSNNNATISNTTALPLNRKLFTATYDNQNKIYIYGGALNGTAIFSDFYSLDITTQQYTKLPDPQVARYGHTASLLSNGQLVIIGGIAQTSNGTISAPMDHIYVFDTKSNTWNIQTVTGAVLPSTRTSHTAVVTSDDRIIIFGGNFIKTQIHYGSRKKFRFAKRIFIVGDNGLSERNKMYLNAIGILDTKSWTWTIPTVNGIPPSRRSCASGGLLSGNHLTVAFGSSSNSYYNDINVLDITTNQWLQSFSASTDNSSSGVSTGMIVGVTIACVIILVIILFLLWRFQGYVRWFLKRVHRDIWKPRTGEPVWAETTRIVFQIFLLFIFAVFLAFVIRQAIDSPNVTQTIEEANSQVDVPDVRFCFDGYPSYPPTDARTPGVTCQTDNGYTCSSFIQPLNMTVFQPTFADNLGAVNCFLFRAPGDFVLTSTSGANNGSRLLFTFWGDQSISYGRVHASIYPKKMDPNVVIYGIQDSITTLMPEDQVLNWQINERNDIQATNVFDIQPYTYSAAAYNLINHQYLQNVGWNYVGFLPITNSTPEVDTSFRQEAQNPNYVATHQDIGVMAVFPLAFVTTIEREVKMYTLVNALGFVGGIFGLLVAVQTWLFGYRPRSPWGVVHRWSIGDMKRSLLRGLQSKFKITESGVPLIHPVHHRFSVTDFNTLGDYEESETQRINRVEERMQMLEMLFKAYYVDDEVFRSLDNANRAGALNRMAANSNNTIQPSHNDSGRLFSSPSFTGGGAAVLRTEKMVDDSFSSNGTGGAKPANPTTENSHPFTRQNTDQSSASQIPLTYTQHQHAPPYQPTTTVQMHDDDL